MNKNKFKILLIIILMIPIVVFGENNITQEILNEKLSQIPDSYTLDSNDNIKEKVLEKINEIIDESINKNLTCEESKCIIQLESEDIKSDKKEINIVIEDNQTPPVEDKESEEPIKDTTANISYSTHVQYIGWQKYVNNGNMSGTSGKSLRLEGIKINLESALGGYIDYQTHIQNIGWQNYVGNNELSGTTGKSLRLEAIRIRLNGEVSEYYDIYYRVHIQDYGWLPWTKNGEAAGSEGYSKRLEAIEIKLLQKGDTSIETNSNSFIVKDAKISYQVHGQNYGYQSLKSEGTTAGTTGKGLRLEAIKINLDTKLDGSIEYQSFVEQEGWEEAITTNGEFSGTIGESKAIQLIKMNLTGSLAERYDIYYRVHSEMYGWLDWAKNGEIAGVNHYSIQAIQIKLYLKVETEKNALPTKKHYIEKVKYIPVYYMQKDSRWNKIYYGNYQFGSTGCAPTSMAMAFTGILGRTILPTEIANYLYNYTNEFNKKTQGSSGLAIVEASKHYNIKRTALKDKDEIIEALKDGKIVYTAMGNGKFAKPTYNHAIILYGYNTNGTTNAYDPLKQFNNGQVSIDLLWNEQSKDEDDYSGGSNFHSLERY